jgi:hypothetical protein
MIYHQTNSMRWIPLWTPIRVLWPADKLEARFDSFSEASLTSSEAMFDKLGSEQLQSLITILVTGSPLRWIDRSNFLITGRSITAEVYPENDSYISFIGFVESRRTRKRERRINVNIHGSLWFAEELHDGPHTFLGSTRDDATKNFKDPAVDTIDHFEYVLEALCMGGSEFSTSCVDKVRTETHTWTYHSGPHFIVRHEPYPQCVAYEQVLNASLILSIWMDEYLYSYQNALNCVFECWMFTENTISPL